MQRELITLFSAVRLPSTSSRNDPLATQTVRALNGEIGVAGYTFDKTVLDGLRSLDVTAFRRFRDEILAELGEISGQSFSSASVLFSNFPYSTPNQWDYLVRRMIGYVQNQFGHGVSNTVLSCGHMIDKDLFNLEEFGACPICQHQVAELQSPDEAVHEYQRTTRLKLLRLADDGFIARKAADLLTRKGSLSETEKAFLREGSATPLARRIGEEFLRRQDTSIFGETLPFVYALIDSDDYIGTLMSGATDVLRIATFVSNPEGDLSLAENTKFRISTRNRRRLLTLMNGTDNLTADMMRHREKWLRLGEELRPNSMKNRVRYPNVAAAFDLLRNRPNSIATFSRTIERSVRARKFGTGTLQALAARPGEFLRRLDVILRNDVDHDAFFKSLKTALPGARTKMLFEVRKYLMHRIQNHQGDRVFLPKGNSNRAQVVGDRRRPLRTSDALETISTINAELFTRFAKLEPIGRIAISPALDKVVMPYNVRGDSETNTAVAKGSAYPVFSEQGGPIVRLFCYWKHPTDLDLSAIFLDENFEQSGHVAYTNLKDGHVVHSGDIQNGKDGAAEYIDFNPDVLFSEGHRYLAATAISFRGVPFSEYGECYAGFMERDALKSGHRFEPTSVGLKFKIGGSSRSHMPLIFDLKEKTVIFVDVATAGDAYQAVARGYEKFSALTRMAVELPLRKPTAYEVIEAHVLARGGEIVSVIDNPDRVFDLSSDLNEIAAEFMA